jgi:quercetin dioxygenase-like cupin family protein
MREAKVLRASQAETAEFDWGRLFWYASGKLGNSEHMTVGKCVIKPGCGNPGHHHPDCEEILHVLSGKILHHVEAAEPVEMGPGDTIALPAGLSHSAKNVGDEDAVLAIAFSSAERHVVGE